MSKNNNTVIIYTDGGCDPNPGVGGWGAVLICGDRRKELSGGMQDTTNNRMEMTAAIRALEALTRPCDVELHTDSQYLQRGVTEWMPNWKRKNWTRGKKEVKNLDLWKRLDELCEQHSIDWRWVPGHVGVTENECCDQLAAREILRIKNGA